MDISCIFCAFYLVYLWETVKFLEIRKVSATPLAFVKFKIQRMLTTSLQESPIISLKGEDW